MMVTARAQEINDSDLDVGSQHRHYDSVQDTVPTVTASEW